MIEDLINIFECKNSFQVKKKIDKITNGLKLDLLVELNNTYYFDYLLNNLSKQIDKDLTEIDENFSFEFQLFSLKNGILERSEIKMKIEKLTTEAFDNVMLDSWIFDNILNEYLNEFYQNQQPEPEAIDLSDTTATEKIIYLQKLGIIDFLIKQQPFQTSINSLATVLSAVTGAKIITIQPMLNAMLSKNTKQKNNPLNSQKPTDKVTKQLIHIGFNVDETI